MQSSSHVRDPMNTIKTMGTQYDENYKKIFKNFHFFSNFLPAKQNGSDEMESTVIITDSDTKIVERESQP